MLYHGCFSCCVQATYQLQAPKGLLPLAQGESMGPYKLQVDMKLSYLLWLDGYDVK